MRTESGNDASLSDPCSHGVAIDISSTNWTPTETPRAIYVGGAGDLIVVMQGNGMSVTFTAVPAGTILPIRVSRVTRTGTTATALIALW